MDILQVLVKHDMAAREEGGAIVVNVPPTRVVQEAIRVRALLTQAGCSVLPLQRNGWHVMGSYDPSDDSAVVEVFED